MHPPFVSVWKQSLVVVAVVEHLAQYDVFRTRRIDIGPFLHEIRSGPAIVDENVGDATDPDSD